MHQPQQHICVICLRITTCHVITKQNEIRSQWPNEKKKKKKSYFIFLQNNLYFSINTRRKGKHHSTIDAYTNFSLTGFTIEKVSWNSIGVIIKRNGMSDIHIHQTNLYRPCDYGSISYNSHANTCSFFWWGFHFKVTQCYLWLKVKC